MGSQGLEQFLPLLGNLGVAGIGLFLLIKGILVTGVERDHWRQAWEQEHGARVELEKTLAAQTERTAFTAQLLHELRAAHTNSIDTRERMP
jgi:hypothetical protein